MLKFLKPSMKPHISDVKAAVGWGVAAGAGALYLVQPWGWIRQTFFEKPEEQK
ncbi:hypothetical protein vseg_008799 [Gypsophila vaccaria]